jgi:hypothetical protein
MSTVARIALTPILLLFLMGQASAALAARSLNYSERRALARAGVVQSWDGRTVVRRAACIHGRLSTVNRRYAVVLAPTSRTCVRRYGVAQGEVPLFRRPSPTSRRWRFVGMSGDTCTAGTGGASRQVLRDLGCSAVV